MNKRNIIIAILILAALLIYPFRGQLRQAFSGGETGMTKAPAVWVEDQL